MMVANLMMMIELGGCEVNQSAREVNYSKCFELLLESADTVLKHKCLNNMANRNKGVRVIQLLLETGIDPDATIRSENSVAFTPLMNACSSKAHKCVLSCAALARTTDPSALRAY